MKRISFLSILSLLFLIACSEGFQSDPSAVSFNTKNVVGNKPGPGGGSTGGGGGSPPIDPPTPGTTRVCTQLSGYGNADRDAGSVLQSCIDNTPNGHTVELPPGKYLTTQQIKIRSPIHVRTQGKSESSAPCSYQDNHDCAEIRASANFYVKFGVLLVEGSSSGGQVDHIVVNGNRQVRGFSQAHGECASGTTNHYGFNMMVECANCKITNNVSKFALCGSGLQINSVDNILVSRNQVYANGIHGDNLWSDGLTIGNLTNSTVTDNVMVDNTDVDFIVGGCENCIIQNNRVLHSNNPASSSFAAMMLFNFVGAGQGNFTGSDISGNSIDCGSQKNCGFGFYIGADAWSTAPELVIFGGTVHNNSVRNAQAGFVVDKISGEMEIFDNFVESSGGRFNTGCGMKTMAAYSIDGHSVNLLNRSRDSVPTSSYSRIEWDGCIPNWWQ
jgi:hypothetical protein